jgi:hypothetical protein
LRYPGSSVIVSDAAFEARSALAMSLWDISAEVVADLQQVFPHHDVIHSSVDASAEAVRSADLLFIDPPALADQWELVMDLMSHGRHMLAWLPVNAAATPGSVKVSSIAEEQFRQVSALPSMFCTRVLWAHGGRTIGCLLAYRSSAEGVASIRQAVDEVVRLCSWTRKEVEHVDPKLAPSPNPPATGSRLAPLPQLPRGRRR